MDTSRGSKIMEKKILILTSFVSGMGEWKRSLNELIRFYLKIKIHNTYYFSQWRSE